MVFEQQPLGPVVNLLPCSQDERLPGLHEVLPPEATRERISYLPAQDPVWLQTDGLFEGLEKVIFGSVVCLDLLVEAVCPQTTLVEPVMWHFSGDWGRLPLVAAADDLGAPTLEPVEEGFQSGAGHCANLVPDDHTGNEHGECPILSGVQSIWPLQGKKLLVCHQPPSQPSSISLAALGEFADDRAGLVSTVGQPDLSLILEASDRFPDFE